MLVLVPVEIKKPNLSFLLANAVNYAKSAVMTFPVVHNKPIAGKMCFSSSSLEKCSFDFVSFLNLLPQYDGSNLAYETGKILLDKVYVSVVFKTDIIIFVSPKLWSQTWSLLSFSKIV